MLRTHRTKILALLLLASGLAIGALVWQTNTRTTTRTTSGTTGGGDVYTHAEDPATCSAQASAFTDYPLVWAGPSVLGYPLTHCSHMMTKTRRVGGSGPVSHPGGDSWAFVYGTCTVPEGRESCAPPISIDIDPCALLVDGKIIPGGGSASGRSMTVRGAQALIQDHGISFEQSPQIIEIYASGSSPNTAEQVANAVAFAEALIPANALAEALSQGAPLTTVFLAAPDAFCASSSGAATTPIAGLTTTPPPPVTPPPALTLTRPPSCCLLQLDMDPATAGVQAARSVGGPQDISIDVVLGEDAGNLGVFRFGLFYDDTRLTPAGVNNGGLDGNPDFNDAALGTTWNCGLGGSPSADHDPRTGPGHGVAFLACVTTAAGSTVSSATVVATLRLHVAASGASSITVGGGYFFSHYDSTIIGACDQYASPGTMTCTGGSVTAP